MRNVFCLLFCLFTLPALAQPKTFVYRISFTDKALSPYSLSRPGEFLSERSLERRKAQGFGLDETDLPVSPAYLDSLRAKGAIVLFSSRWLNTATVETEDSLYFQKITPFAFVDNAKPVVLVNIMDTMAVQASSLVAAAEYSESDYGDAYRQISIHNGQQLHNAGYRGQGMQIAMLDGGYYRTDTLPQFKNLRRNGGILATWDFHEGNDSVYEDNRHGMNVLSIMAAFVPGKLVGTSPDAKFYLLKTESSDFECLVEEDAWVAGLEWADSAGAQLVNSSLGYTRFNYDFMDHTYQDLDGETAHASKAAGMAASKGMIVVNSAGNEGNKDWYYISVPADAKDILTVGAIDKDLNMGYLSSRGPASDGRVKPDVCAMGVQVTASNSGPFEFWRINGTSASAPIITGLTACLWQAYPQATSYEVMAAVRQSSTHYFTPNDSFGYGIPDYAFASRILAAKFSDKEDLVIDAFPNPFYERFTVNFYTHTAFRSVISVFDLTGRLYWQANMQTAAESMNALHIDMDGKRSGGIYLVIIDTPGGRLVQKVMQYKP